MSFTTRDAAIRVTPEMEARIKTANTEEIKAIMAEAALAQGLVTPDPFDPTQLNATALADAAPRRLAKVIRLNGVAHAIESSDEAGLLAAENAIYREALAQRPA